jgi:hypothetical protein
VHQEEMSYVKVINNKDVFLFSRPRLSAAISYVDSNGKDQTASIEKFEPSRSGIPTSRTVNIPANARNVKVVTSVEGGSHQCTSENVRLPFCVRVTGSLHHGGCDTSCR